MEDLVTAFADLELKDVLQRALVDLNYTTPTPIQALAIPPLLEGRDVLGCAQTGTGKTAAYALPILQHLSSQPMPRSKTREVRALVLAPTRELAFQIGEAFSGYGQHSSFQVQVVVGGVKAKRQVESLKRGCDILVATPGRLRDFLSLGILTLDKVEFFVLDEADRMLDMGFFRDVQKILKRIPEQRQGLLFSATMPADVVNLARTFLRKPALIDVTLQSMTVEQIKQEVMFVEQQDKRLLLAHLLRSLEIEQALVFVRTKHRADRLVKQLGRKGLEVVAIHSDKSQKARTAILEAFREGEISVLVATDVASRGLDVDDVSHVFNFDLPQETESYIHRIGRTGRAGRDGIAISFCGPEDGEKLREIEALIGFKVRLQPKQPWHTPITLPPSHSAGKPGRDEKRWGKHKGSNTFRPTRDRKRKKPKGSVRGQGRRRLVELEQSLKADNDTKAKRKGKSTGGGKGRVKPSLQKNTGRPSPKKSKNDG